MDTEKIIINQKQINNKETNKYINADLILKTFENIGIKNAFGIPGGPLTPLYNALCGSKIISTTLCQHEGGAAFMALGRSVCRTNKKDIGLCFSTAGPGATNLITGVAAAYEERVPIFVLTANPSTKHKGKWSNQDSYETGIDIVKIFSAITCKSVMLNHNNNAVDTINELFDLAITNNKPVHLNIPIDVSTLPINDFNTQQNINKNNISRKNILHENAKINEALNKFISSKKPLIFAGHGVKTSNYQIHLKEISEILSLPVMVTSHAKGVFPEDHPLYAGIFGFAAPEKGRKFLETYKPDAIMFLGTRLGEVATSGWSPILSLPELKIHVDLDPNVFDKNYQVTYELETDILDIFLEMLNIANKKSYNILKNQNKILNTRYSILSQSEYFQDMSGILSPKTVMNLLEFHLPDDVVLFSEIGSSMAWIINQIKIREGQDFYVMLGLGSMGSGLCGAIGAKTAMPKRPVLCISGDAATLMHGTEMFSAVNSNIPVKIIVLNDGGHGIVHHGSKMLGFNNIIARYPQKANLKKFAESLGVKSYQVATASDFLKLPFDDIMHSNKVELIELIINPDIVAPILDRAKIIGLAEKL